MTEKKKNDNLKLWNSVCKTDPKFTKEANVRGNNITSIAPQYRIMQATKQFGPYGSSWGLKNLEYDYDLVEKAGIVKLSAVFFYPGGSFEIGSCISLFRDNAHKKPDQDFVKKLETDTLTKAMSKIGISADVFMGSFDDDKYITAMKEEFQERPPKPKGSHALKTNIAPFLTAILGSTSLEEFEQIKIDFKEPFDKIMGEWPYYMTSIEGEQVKSFFDQIIEHKARIQKQEAMDEQQEEDMEPPQ